MKLRIFKLSFVIIILHIASLCQAQNNSTQNTFSLKLNVPVIIDEKIKTEYIPERMQDELQEYHDKKSYFTVEANNVSLNYANNLFWGTYESQYFPFEKITIYGRFSDDQMTLENMKAVMQWQTNDKYRKESEIAEIRFENVPMYNGVCFFDKTKSKIELIKYDYSKIEIYNTPRK
jgi:hypothetical protein